MKMCMNSTWLQNTHPLLRQAEIKERVFCVFKEEFMLSANRDNLTSLFPICIPFMSFSCLTVLAKPVSTMLNKSGE